MTNYPFCEIIILSNKYLEPLSFSQTRRRRVATPMETRMSLNTPLTETALYKMLSDRLAQDDAMPVAIPGQTHVKTISPIADAPLADKAHGESR